MKWFSERDVRRHYDLLQHTEDRGVTALMARDDEQVIGLGLFDNEEDFVSECARYNRNGSLFVGVNPRKVAILDGYGGLRNRIRTLFSDISDTSDVGFVTGLAVPADVSIPSEMAGFARDASVLSDGQKFFALDEPLELDGNAAAFEGALQARIAPNWSYGLLQYVPVAGTAHPTPHLFRRRFSFKRYRPYFIEGLRVYLNPVTTSSAF